MAKRKNRQPRPIGLERNNNCPHCGQKVKNTLYLEDPRGEYVVNHWFTKNACLSDEEKITNRLRERMNESKDE